MSTEITTATRRAGMRTDDARHLLGSLASLAATVQIEVHDEEMRQIAQRDIVEVLSCLNEVLMPADVLRDPSAA